MLKILLRRGGALGSSTKDVTLFGVVLHLFIIIKIPISLSKSVTSF